MADADLQKQPAGRGPGRRFAKGQSGNPSGRPRGSRNRATALVEALLDGEAEALGRKILDLALAGDTVALRLCLDRIVPPRREREVTFSLPPLNSATDAATAAASILRAVAAGEILPGQAAVLGQLIETYNRSTEAADFDLRLRRLEKQNAATGT